MKGRPSDPVEAVRAEVAARLDDAGGGPCLVALSGGLDSMVLLHALRFSRQRTGDVSAAHFDHGMRPGSGGDAAWVRGVCRAWGVELVEGGLGPSDPVPKSEDDARTLRYDFLEGVARQRDAVLLTAHHADDQAETVLFRVLRGTGIEGLAGIPRRRRLGGDGGTDPVDLVRPLLDLTRGELEEYARRCHVPHRADPSNESGSFARNVIRNTLLPLAEDQVAPGARRSLVRLARIAEEEGAAWASAMRLVLPALGARGVSAGADPCPPDEPEWPSCRRDALLELDPALAGRVLRLLAGELGLTLDSRATGRALAFVEGSQSGRHIELGGGVELHLKEGRVAIVPPAGGSRRASRPSRAPSEASFDASTEPSSETSTASTDRSE